MLSGAVFTSYLVMAMGLGTIVLVNAISPGVLHEMTTTLPGHRRARGLRRRCTRSPTC